MSHERGPGAGGFDAIASTAVAGLDATLGEYRHTVSGARHLHLERDAEHEAFMVALRTPATDSSGVAHVLEHLVLGGSQRFPCRQAFFSMLGRTLAASMNAMTTAQWTTFHFATHDAQDFDNLLAVYLDAVFFPLLHPLDFAQEGCRLEFEVPSDPTTALVHRGVVLNEVRGIAHDPDYRLERAVERALLGAGPWRHDAGGEPEALEGLEHQAVRDWHGRHFHAGNALFLSAGRRSAASLQARMVELAPGAFARASEPLSIPVCPPLAAPVSRREPYPAEPGDGGSAAVAWRVGHAADGMGAARAHLAARCLVDQDDGPIRAVLEHSPIGGSPSGVSGLRDYRGPLVLIAGLHGCDAEQARTLEARLLEAMSTLARDGLPCGAVDAAIARLERDLLEQHDPRRPHLLALLERMLPAALHGGDVAGALDPRPVLDTLRAELAAGDAVRNWLREALVDNPDRARVALLPDPALTARARRAAGTALARTCEALGEQGRRRLVERSAALAQRQATPPDESVLPALDLARLSPPRPPPALAAASPRVQTSIGPTTGLVYARLALPVPADPIADDDLLSGLGLLCDTLPHAGRGALDGPRARAAGARIGEGITMTPLALGGRLWLLLEARALTRHADALLAMLDETARDAHFDEDAVSAQAERALAARLSALGRRGHVDAECAAAATLGGVHRALERCCGLASVGTRRATIAHSVAHRAVALAYDRLVHERPWVHVTAEDQGIARAAAAIWPGESADRDIAPAGGDGALEPEPLAGAGGGQPTLWRVRGEVSYCARVYRAVAPTHPDAAPLAVLAAHVGGAPLQRAIRERGGAYGAGARYCARSETVRLFSFRDPRLTATFEDFEREVATAIDSPPAGSVLEGAKLRVLRELDRPRAFQQAAREAFLDRLGGLPPDARARLRERVLAVTPEQAAGAGGRHLGAGQGADAALASAAHAERHAAAGWTVREVDAAAR